MPSLPTRNDCPESYRDSYRRYLPPSYQLLFEASHGESELVVFAAFFQFMFICIFVVLLLLLPNWGFMFLKNHISSTYWNHYGLQVIHDLYWYCILSLYSYCFTKLCYKKMPKEHITHPCKLFKHHWKMSLFMISGIVTLFIYSCNTILYYLVKDANFYHYHILCNVQDCSKETISNLWMYVFTPPLVLLINCMIVHGLLFGVLTMPIISDIIKWCCPRYTSPNNQNIINSHPHNSPSNKSKSITILNNNCIDDDLYKSITYHDKKSSGLNYSILSASDISVGLTRKSTNNLIDRLLLFDSNNSDTPNTANTSNISNISNISNTSNTSNTSNNAETQRLNKKRQKDIIEKGFKKFQRQKYPEIFLLRYITLYSICYLLLLFGYWTTSLLKKEIYKTHFEAVYIFILSLISIAKLIIKRTVRLIDASRSNSTQRHKHLRNPAKRRKSERKHKSRKRTSLSMELFTELFMSIIYWFAYRELMMYSVPGWNAFLKAQLIHMSSEFMSTSIRPSEIYYNITSELQSYWCNDDESNDMISTVDVDVYALKSLIPWKDDSTITQWKVRCALDIIMRMIASVVSASAIIVQVVLLGSDQYNLEQDEFIRGIEYLAISVLIEILYFTMVHIINEIYRFNLIEPFWAIYSHNRSLLIFVCSILIVQAFWEPDL